jgi:subtilisin family serine protease
VSLWPFINVKGDILFKLNKVKKKIEKLSLEDATPFSNSFWEKNLRVYSTNVAKKHKESPSSVDLNWNLYGEFGVEISDSFDLISDVKVAVIDTGVIEHNEFNGKLLPGYDFISNDNLSFDGDGRDSDFSPNLSFSPSCGTEVQDLVSHGTHVTGIIVSEGTLENSNIGVSPGALILPVRALGPCGGTLIDVVESLLWVGGEVVDNTPVNDNVVSVVNLSLGGPGKCPEALQGALDILYSKGIVSVVAAGNSSMDLNKQSFFPANCERVITVGATNIDGYISDYSNYGDDVFFAPGGDSKKGIYSTVALEKDYINNNFGIMVGTSMAAPHVSGMVAHIKTNFPKLGYDSVEKVLKKSINDYGVLSYSELSEVLKSNEMIELEKIEMKPATLNPDDDQQIAGCGSIDFGGRNNAQQINIISLIAGLLLFRLVNITHSKA